MYGAHRLASTYSALLLFREHGLQLKESYAFETAPSQFNLPVTKAHQSFKLLSHFLGKRRYGTLCLLAMQRLNIAVVVDIIKGAGVLCFNSSVAEQQVIFGLVFAFENGCFGAEAVWLSVRCDRPATCVARRLRRPSEEPPVSLLLGVGRDEVRLWRTFYYAEGSEQSPELPACEFPQPPLSPGARPVPVPVPPVNGPHCAAPAALPPSDGSKRPTPASIPRSAGFVHGVRSL